MSNLTPEGARLVADVAARNGFSNDAVLAMLNAVAAGQGSQAQFNHPEFGGMGQWSQGGMIMVGDMFNQDLKARVDRLCTELSGLVRNQSNWRPATASSQSRSQGNSNFSLFVPGSSAPNSWWPSNLGTPGSIGAQNDLRYAYFPENRRLAIDLHGQVRVYDTGNHLVSGFSQQQSGDQSLTFTSQFGLNSRRRLTGGLSAGGNAARSNAADRLGARTCPASHGYDESATRRASVAPRRDNKRGTGYFCDDRAACRIAQEGNPNGG